MERLIDADKLLKAMDTWDKFGYSARYGLERLDKDDKDFIPYVHYGDMLKAVNGMSTVEAIPKDRITKAIDKVEKYICDVETDTVKAQGMAQALEIFEQVLGEVRDEYDK